jgi:hypothetical protein
MTEASFVETRMELVGRSGLTRAKPAGDNIRTGGFSRRIVSFCFAIPVRSKAASKNWQGVEARLSATLTSILAQSDTNFIVLAACHDVPSSPELADPRVTVLRTDTPPPRDFAEMMLDKKHKRRMMAVEFGRRGAGFFMLTDEDDLVSNRLVEFARSTNDPNGYIVKAGWIYDSTNQTLVAHPALNLRCGTCAIFNFAKDDLPTSMDDTVHRRHDDFGKHFEFEETAAALGRPLRPIPFPSVIYVVHGENFSIAEKRSAALPRRVVRYIRRLPEALKPRRKPSDAIRQEFSLR